MNHGQRDEIAGLAREVIEAASACGIRCCVGGSVASSIHGVVRATADIDFVMLIDAAGARSLVELLSDRMHGDPDAAAACIASGRAFNLIDLSTMLKVDVFPAHDWFSVAVIDRAVLVAHVPIASAEDVILAKLRWFREGGCSSDRQWQDVLGVLRSVGAGLDRRYLASTADRLSLGDLLAKAIDAA
ncbi:MAG: hypothetical protein DWH93_01300 [Planctomycetota bacterium]|nr:MAG: hypothetical protein DWH93_01300 [Planctomycetota bacterium]